MSIHEFSLTHITALSTIAIIGKRGAGKSHLTKHLIEKLNEIHHFDGGFIVNVSEERSPVYSEISDDIYLEFDQEEFDNFCLNKKNKYLVIDNSISDHKFTFNTHNNLTILTNQEYSLLQKIKLNPNFIFLLKESRVNDIRKYHEVFNIRMPFNQFKDLLSSVNDFKAIVIDVNNNQVYTYEQKDMILVEENVVSFTVQEMSSAEVLPLPATEVFPLPATEVLSPPVTEALPLHLPATEVLPTTVGNFSQEEILLGIPIKNTLSEVKILKSELVNQLTQRHLSTDSFEFNYLVEIKMNKSIHNLLEKYNSKIAELETNYKMYNTVKTEYMESI